MCATGGTLGNLPAHPGTSDAALLPAVPTTALAPGINPGNTDMGALVGGNGGGVGPAAQGPLLGSSGSAIPGATGPLLGRGGGGAPVNTFAAKLSSLLQN